MSENTDKTSSGLGEVAQTLLGSSDFQNSLLDFAKPMLAAQEAVLTKVIESQNAIQELLVKILDELQNKNKGGE